MTLLDRFSFRQEPTGAFKQILKLPVPLFRWHLGFVFGSRFAVIVSRGHRTKLIRHTPVEVVEHGPEENEIVVVSGLGATSDWYRNISAEPALEIWFRDERWGAPRQRFLDTDEAGEVFRRYWARHPKTAARLLASMGRSYDGSEESLEALVGDMPMVAFRPR